MPQLSPAPFTETAAWAATLPSFRQMVLAAQFGAFARMEDDLDVIIHEACWVAARGVGAGFAGVLQYRADEDAFVLKGGIGWPARMVGRTRIAAHLGTTAGLAWLTGQLVHFRNLDKIDRLRIPETMIRYGVHRMVSVPIRNGNMEAFGVFEVGSTEAGKFARHDLPFLQELADGLAAAVNLRASRTEQPASTEEQCSPRTSTAHGGHRRPGPHPGEPVASEVGFRRRPA